MRTAVPFALALVLVALAGIHIYWAVTGAASGSGFVPESHGQPLFHPSRLATVAVAAALLVAAYIAAARGQLMTPAAPGSLIHWLCIGAGVVFVLRAVGEFHYVGFFKSVHGTRFAALDTWVFSPLCLAIGAAFLFISTISPRLKA